MKLDDTFSYQNKCLFIALVGPPFAWLIVLIISIKNKYEYYIYFKSFKMIVIWINTFVNPRFILERNLIADKYGELGTFKAASMEVCCSVFGIAYVVCIIYKIRQWTGREFVSSKTFFGALAIVVTAIFFRPAYTGSSSFYSNNIDNFTWYIVRESTYIMLGYYYLAKIIIIWNSWRIFQSIK